MTGGLAHFSTGKKYLILRNDRRLFIFSQLFFLKQSSSGVDRSEMGQRMHKKFESRYRFLSKIKVHKRKTRYYPRFVRNMVNWWYYFYIFSYRFLNHQRQRGYWNASSSDGLCSHSMLQEKERTWLYVCKSIQEACPISLLQSRLKQDDQADLKDSSIKQFQG